MRAEYPAEFYQKLNEVQNTLATYVDEESKKFYSKYNAIKPQPNEIFEFKDRVMNSAFYNHCIREIEHLHNIYIPTYIFTVEESEQWSKQGSKA